MEGSIVASRSSCVQRNSDLDKDDPNNDMSKSVWMLVNGDFDIEPEKSESDLTQVCLSSMV